MKKSIETNPHILPFSSYTDSWIYLWAKLSNTVGPRKVQTYLHTVVTTTNPVSKLSSLMTRVLMFHISRYYLDPFRAAGLDKSTGDWHAAECPSSKLSDWLSVPPVTMLGRWSTTAHNLSKAYYNLNHQGTLLCFFLSFFHCEKNATP